MSIFDFLSLVGGLSLFLFGMSEMSSALKRAAGSRLKALLRHLTDRRLAGLFTGLIVTALIQSSSATTVMVVGFVDAGLMTLSQALGVIMGANIGTTVTAWILGLTGIESANFFVRLLKPSSFSPILALIGIILYMGSKKEKNKDIGAALIGFAVLMFGMQEMSGAVSGLKDSAGFTYAFTAFSNPLLGVAAGMILTAIIQSSSASVGILEALAATGQVTYGAAIPIIMGQNIGTCVTALISSVGTDINARRAAIAHLLFNVIGVALCLSGFYIVRMTADPELLALPIGMFGIALFHTAFNVFSTIVLFPFADRLEALTLRLIPGERKAGETVMMG